MRIEEDFKKLAWVSFHSSSSSGNSVTVDIMQHRKIIMWGQSWLFHDYVLCSPTSISIKSIYLTPHYAISNAKLFDFLILIYISQNYTNETGFTFTIIYLTFSVIFYFINSYNVFNSDTFLRLITPS